MAAEFRQSPEEVLHHAQTLRVLLELVRPVVESTLDLVFVLSPRGRLVDHADEAGSRGSRHKALD